MTTIKHPTLNHSREVPEEAVKEWRAAGWLTDDTPSGHLEDRTSERAHVEVASTEAPQISPKRQPRKG